MKDRNDKAAGSGAPSGADLNILFALVFSKADVYRVRITGVLPRKGD